MPPKGGIFLFTLLSTGYNNTGCKCSMLTIEHIDPRKGVLISGLKNDFNEIIADNSYNSRKSNRFVPYRVCDYPAPVTFGDICEFLIEEKWVVCEFGGQLWWAESNRIGNVHVQKPFLGKKRTQEWKEFISKLQKELWETRDKSQIQSLGRSKHKRNPKPGQIAASLTGHPHKRKHWDEELFEEVRKKYLNKTSFRWGRKELCEKYGVTTRTIENMVKHIKEGKTYSELTRNPESV